MIERGICARLKEDTDIIDFAGIRAIDRDDDPNAAARVYPTDGAAAPAYPSIFYHRIAAERTEHLLAASGMVTASIQVESWSQVDYYSAAKSLADMVRLSLDGQQWTAAGYTATSWLDNEQDKLQKIPGSNVRYPSVVQTYTVVYEEAIA